MPGVRNYRIQMSERWFIVKNSKNIEPMHFGNSQTGTEALGSILSTNFTKGVKGHKIEEKLVAVGGAVLEPAAKALFTILPWLDPNRTKTTISDKDVKFLTRTFETMPGSPFRFNRKKDLCAIGGDGHNTLLGPCLKIMPGEKLNLLLMNNLHKGFFHIKNVVASFTSRTSFPRRWATGRR